MIETKRIHGILALVFLLLLNFTQATPLQIKGQYVCGVANNLSCIARDVTVLSATNDLSTWEIMYNQFNTGASPPTNIENTTEIYYENSTGFRQRLTDKYLAPPILTPQYFQVNDTRHALDGFIWHVNSTTHLVIFAYSATGDGNPYIAAPIACLRTFDLNTHVISSPVCYTTDPLNHTYRAGGVAIKQINSTDFYFARSSYYGAGGSGEAGVTLEQWHLQTMTAVTTSYVGFQRIDCGNAGSPALISSINYNTSTVFIEFNMLNGSTISLCYVNASRQQSQFFSNTGMSSKVIVTSYGINFGGQLYDLNHTLHTSTRYGNQELFFGRTDGTGATSLTTTVNSEFLSSMLTLPDSTVVLAYYSLGNQESNGTFLDSFCNLNVVTDVPTLGTNCNGIPVGGVCLPCFITNGTLCLPIPNCIFIAPTITLVESDYGCSNVPGAQHVQGGCPQFGSQSGDWVFADYRINNKIALPMSFNITDISTQIEANATCSVCDSTFLNCQPMLFKDSNSIKQPSPLSWDLNVYTTYFLGSPNPALFPSDSIASIICNSTIPATYIRGIMKIANTELNISQASYTIGSASLGFMNKVNTNETPQFRNRITAFNDPFGGSNPTESACITDFLGQSYLNYRGQTYYNPDSTVTAEYISYATGILNLLPSNYYAASYCYGATTEAKRSPMLGFQQSFEVVDQCARLGFFNTTLATAIKNIGGNDTAFFSQGEDVFFYGYYRLGNAIYDKAQCMIQINNRTNDAILQPPTLMSQATGGYYTAFLVSDQNDFRLGIGLNNGGGASGWSLQSGNYSATISCFNTDPTTCVLPQSKTIYFAVNQSDGCAGDASGCTIPNCEPCPATTITCEDGREVAVAPQCVSRVCKQSTFNFYTGNIPEACQYNQRWSIVTTARPNSVACGSDDVIISTMFYDMGVPVPPAQSNVSMACQLTVSGSAAIAVPEIPNKDELLFDVPISNTPTIDFSLKGKIPGFKFANCGVRMAAEVSCYSSKFTSGVKESIGYFYIGAQGQDCTWQGKIVKDGECLSLVTGVDADKPKICYSTKFVDNAQACGCPMTMTANETTNGCDGQVAISQAASFFNFSWLSLRNLLLLIIFIPLLLKAYSVYKSGKPIVNLPPLK